MSRFDDIALARLPPLPLGTDTFSSLKQARLGELVARLEAYGFTYDVGSLETDPLVIANAEAGAARELLMLTRRDDAIRAILLSESWGPFLDALGASQLPPVARNVVIPATAEAAAVMELDDDFRRRIQLAPEALSTCGPEGGYLFFTLAVDGVKTASPLGPMSYGGSPAEPFTPPGEVHVPIVATAGDGTASAALVAQVQAELCQEDRYPIADFITVSAAVIVPYRIVATLKIGAGADPDLVRTTAIARLERQAQRQHRPGAALLRSSLFGAAYLADATGANAVEVVELAEPAADVNADLITSAAPAGAYRAPYCTEIVVTVEVVSD